MNDDDDDDDEIAYFTTRWKTSMLVLSTAPKTWNNTKQNRPQVDPNWRIVVDLQV